MCMFCIMCYVFDDYIICVCVCSTWMCMLDACVDVYVRCSMFDVYVYVL